MGVWLAVARKGRPPFVPQGKQKVGVAKVDLAAFELIRIRANEHEGEDADGAGGAPSARERQMVSCGRAQQAAPVQRVSGLSQANLPIKSAEGPPQKAVPTNAV